MEIRLPRVKANTNGGASNQKASKRWRTTLTEGKTFAKNNGAEVCSKRKIKVGGVLFELGQVIWKFGILPARKYQKTTP